MQKGDTSKMHFATKMHFGGVPFCIYPDAPELNYHNLPVVHNGGEASEAFINMKEKSKEEQKVIREGLLKYCELDTYVMVKIWERFKEIVGEYN